MTRKIFHILGCRLLTYESYDNANDQKFSCAPQARKLFHWYKNIDNACESTKKLGSHSIRGFAPRPRVGFAKFFCPTSLAPLHTYEFNIGK